MGRLGEGRSPRLLRARRPRGGAARAGSAEQPVPRHPRLLMDADCSSGGGSRGGRRAPGAGHRAHSPGPGARRAARPRHGLRAQPRGGREPASSLAAPNPCLRLLALPALPPPPFLPSPPPEVHSGTRWPSPPGPWTDGRTAFSTDRSRALRAKPWWGLRERGRGRGEEGGGSLTQKR